MEAGKEPATPYRSCANCRAMKTRCLPAQTNPDVCERCVRFGRQCVFMPVQKRKPRRKADVRVAELEKEMLSLRALLKQATTATATPVVDEISTRQAEGIESSDGTESRLTASAQSSSISTFSDSLPSSVAHNDRSDPISRGTMSVETASQLVEQYKAEMYPHYPLVYIPPACTAEILRRTRPILFLAVLAGAAGKEYPEIAAKLDQVVLEEYANRAVLRSEKSLELVQALIVSSSWYQPPGRLNQFKYSEFAHMAGVMATDIGIASRPLQVCRSHAEDTASIESRRTYLAVLFKAMGTAISARRQSTMRVTSYALECIRYLEQSPEAVAGDRLLTAWIRLLIIADEIGSAFTYDDPGALASILDIKTQLMTTAFRKRLDEWRQNLGVFEFAPTLQMTYYTIRLYLYEVVLHVDHRPEDFKVPYRMGSLPPYETPPTIPVKPTVEGLSDLLESSHALLDAFMGLNANTARALPLGMFVRVSYAAFILAKLCASAALSDSQLAPLIDHDNLNAELYMNKTLLFIRSSIGMNGCRLPAIFLNLMSQMREWCIHPEFALQSDRSNRVVDSQSYPPTSNGSIGSSSTNTEAVRTPAGSTAAALTGTFEDNYAVFGNEKAVKAATIHGLMDKTVDISDTLVQVKTVLSRGRPNDEMATDWSGLDQWPSEPADVVANILSNEEEKNWLADMMQAEFLHDRHVLFDDMQAIFPDEGSLS